jgi:hypothetical protein
MSPFIANPVYLSSQTLELLDRALGEVWREMQLKNNSPVAHAREIPPREALASAISRAATGGRDTRGPTPRAPRVVKSKGTS